MAHTFFCTLLCALCYLIKCMNVDLFFYFQSCRFPLGHCCEDAQEIKIFICSYKEAKTPSLQPLLWLATWRSTYALILWKQDSKHASRWQSTSFMVRTNMSKVPQMQLILPYEISCIRGSL